MAIMDRAERSLTKVDLNVNPVSALGAFSAALNVISNMVTVYT